MRTRLRIVPTTTASFLTLAMLLAGCSSHVSRISQTEATEPRPSASEALLVAIDVFGVPPAVGDRLLARHGGDLRRLGEAMMRGQSDPAREPLLARVGETGDLVYVEPALVGYFEDDGMKYFMTLDVVQRADAPRRLAFTPVPREELADPDGLIAAWQTYEATVLEMMSRGELSPRRVACSAFHCLGDQGHEALAVRVQAFVAGVPDNFEELSTVLRDERREDHRAAAAYLLAYASDGHEVVRRLLPAIRDESAFVRNSVMRVLADIAFHHPEIEIPLSPVLDALEFPSTTDRNKAAAIIDGLLQRPGAEGLRRSVIERAGPTLVAMLRLRQPNNHDFAYSILKAVSRTDFGERNYDAWTTWLEAQQVR